MRLRFNGKVKGGKLHLDSRVAFGAAVAKLEGRPVTLTLEKCKSIRSLNQNSYFHGVICELISEHTGYEPSEVKDILKQKFLFVDDAKFPRCRPTSSLNTEEMARFTDQCIRWAAQELDLVIPDPERIEAA